MRGSPPPGHDNIPSWDGARGALDQAQMGAARQKFLFLPAETRLKILAHQVMGLPGGLWELLSQHQRDQALHHPHGSQPCLPAPGLAHRTDLLSRARKG